MYNVINTLLARLCTFYRPVSVWRLAMPLSSPETSGRFLNQEDHLRNKSNSAASAQCWRGVGVSFGLYLSLKSLENSMSTRGTESVSVVSSKATAEMEAEPFVSMDLFMDGNMQKAAQTPTRAKVETLSGATLVRMPGEVL